MSNKVASLVAASALLMSSQAFAVTTNTGTLTVSAIVSPACSVNGATPTTTPGTAYTYSFGTFGSSVPATNATFDVTLNCTVGTLYTFGVDAGQNGTVTNRNMKSGAVLLPYSVTVPNTTGFTGVTDTGVNFNTSIAGSGNITATSAGGDSIRLFLHLPAKTGLAVGTYTDQLQLQVSF